MEYQTLSETNQFSFKCPIFGVDTKMATCVKLRSLVWRGVKPPQRKGCQACMEAGKCPAAHVVQKMAMSGHRTPQPDTYASDQPVKGKLRRDLLEKILPVMVLHGTLVQSGASKEEIKLINSSNARITEMIPSAPQGQGKTKTKARIAARTSATLEAVKPEQKNREVVTQAAQSGDMAAAISEV